MMFNQGDTVSYKGKKYVIIMTPLIFQFRTPNGWIPAYLYTSCETGNGYAREASDMEAKFKRSSI
jgi:hypothetical protein